MEKENRSEIQIIGEMLEEIMHTNYEHSEQSYELWFGRLELRRLDSDEAFLVCENELKRKIITEKFTDYIADCLAEVIGYKTNVTIGVDTSLAPIVPDDGTIISPLKILRERQAAEAAEAQRAEIEKEKMEIEVAEKEKELDLFAYENSFAIEIEDLTEEDDGVVVDKEEVAAEFDLMKKDHSFVYNEDYTFEKFVVSGSNSFAHAAAINVADNVGMKINPLFIYGSSGLGKTHLMYAIANRAKQRNPKMNIICMKGEEFMTELIEAIKKGTQKKFRQKYRGTDMLLLDDIQFLAGKEATQNEFFHTFDALYEDHKQIIITSDKPPREMITLEERIRSRFESGLVVDIQPPDYELRLAILQNKADQNGLVIPTDVLTYLAERLQSNIRQIEGVIKKLGASHFLSGLPVTIEMVRSSVPEFLKESESENDLVKRIVDCVASRYNTTPDEIYGRKRTKDIKNARNVATKIIRDMTSLSLPKIGALMGNRDYSTVHSNLQAVENQIVEDPSLEAVIEDIVKEIKRK